MWLGGYKLSGKTNYVTETLHREDTLYGGPVSPYELEWKRRKQLFVMREMGHAMSLDEVNELLNLWNKGIVTSPFFETVCEQSQYVMVSRSCSFDTFGNDIHRRAPPSVENDILRLMNLFDKANIFPKRCEEKRELHEKFWWDIVRPRTNVGKKSARDKESVCENPAVFDLFEVLCQSESNRDYEEFEIDNSGDDDEDVSVVSSTMGEACNLAEETLLSSEDLEENWNEHDEKKKEATIDRSMKKLGNVKKRKMSKFILKDLLGSDAKLAIRGIAKSHQKLQKRHKLRINDIYRAVKYFDQKFKSRRALLQENARKSASESYSRRQYSWLDEYNTLMKR